MAEGSFFFKKNNDACFQLKQKNHDLLFSIFNHIFFSNRKIGNDKGYHCFSLSSKIDIQTVINFFSFEGNHPLMGYKLIQYENWLKKLKNTNRYKDLNFPM